MKRLAIPFEPHEDGVRCGECRFGCYYDGPQCALFPEDMPGITEDEKWTFVTVRSQSCLAGEKALADLVEAERVAHESLRDWGQHGTARKLEAALAALESLR